MVRGEARCRYLRYAHEHVEDGILLRDGGAQVTLYFALKKALEHHRVCSGLRKCVEALDHN